jgi:mRNA interferase YafQ
MLTPHYSRAFEKDLKRMLKRGKNVEKIKGIIRSLVNQEILDPRFRDHKLIGNYKDRRDCHVEPDWILIYKMAGDAIIFERTGTHADLFE